jgi:hypothetical protein
LAWYRKKPSEKRDSVSRERLQSAITEAVKEADPKCQGFVGVIVQCSRRWEMLRKNEPGQRDAAETVQRLLAVLDKNDVVHALDRIKRGRVLRLVD